MSQPQVYFVPQPSHWPIVGAVALFLMMLGMAMSFNGVTGGSLSMFAGLFVLIVMMYGWFGDVIRESVAGKLNKQVDMSFRWAMGWFIFSEVMFFVTFFGVLYYLRVHTTHELATQQSLLWPDFKTLWPSAGPGFKETFTPMKAAGLPAINTFLLLTSGATLTWAHWGLVANKRKQLCLGLFLTVLLGAIFVCLQAWEYSHAYHELNLKMTTGVYGSTFYMLTGFHGFHVTIGAIMLSVILYRSLKGHFSEKHHFAFEAVAWYWHFVDVVWVILFVFVYWL